VCMVATAFFVLMSALGRQLSPIGLIAALVGFIYSIAANTSQMRAIRTLKANGISASIWYLWLLLGLIFLAFELIVETVLFLVYGRGVLKRSWNPAHPETARPG